MTGSIGMPYREYWRDSRLHPVSVPGDRVSTMELAILVVAGVLSATAVAFMPLPLRIPGHAIVKAALPMVLGMALVPRGFAGTISGLAAGGTVGVFLMTGIGHLQAAAITSLLAIGPAMDVAVHGATRGGWQLALRFGVAGLCANLLAFVVRWGTDWLELDGNWPHTMRSIGWAALLSFALCGVFAGTLSAWMCVRGSRGSR